MSTKTNEPKKPTTGLSGNAHQRRKLRREPKREKFRADLKQKQQ